MIDIAAYYPYPERPVVSQILLFLIVTTLLWIGRRQFQSLLRSACGFLHRTKRFLGRWLSQHAQSMLTRYHELAVAYHLDELAHDLERQFRRVGQHVDKTVSLLPGIRHDSASLIDRIRSDHRDSSDLAPVLAIDLPEVIDAVASTNWLKQVSVHHRANVKKKIRTLANLGRPMGRLDGHLQTLGGLLEKLNNRGTQVDGLMSRYEQLYASRDLNEFARHSSIFVHFSIALLGVLIAVGGSILNFFLVERPMAEMLGQSFEIGGMSTSEAGALIIILLEAFAGMVFMDAIGVTNVLPVVKKQEERTRTGLAIVSGAFIVILAIIEVGLAYMRELLIAADFRTQALVTGSDPSVAADFLGNIPIVLQAGLGFLIPFVLAVSAIALETFVRTGRIVIQWLGWLLTAGLAYAIRLIVRVIKALEDLALRLYDALIFLQLFVEKIVRVAVQALRKRLGTRR